MVRNIGVAVASLALTTVFVLAATPVLPIA
jgi:hypothetical protein